MVSVGPKSVKLAHVVPASLGSGAWSHSWWVLMLKGGSMDGLISVSEHLSSSRSSAVPVYPHTIGEGATSNFNQA